MWILKDEDCFDFFISFFHGDFVESRPYSSMRSCGSEGEGNDLKKHVAVMMPGRIQYIESAENGLDKCNIWVTAKVSWPGLDSLSEEYVEMVKSTVLWDFRKRKKLC